ncbi:hypothetical protein [Streptomyces sp. MST-110588]|uniref:hypothetical protein n=1 Tax=Streptomyces sp. MST-110588 TaxID=2833628 RepID=UPI001F5C8412|nr:hypothetical protein [Streptomyces sp. MST-110588]UNO41920.1 hypothetical protein KGS77_23225 [Streptomyces sp. MST-110588]
MATGTVLLAASAGVPHATAASAQGGSGFCGDTIAAWKGSAYTGNLKPKEGSLIKVNIVINDKGDKAEIRVFAASWGETGVRLDTRFINEVSGENNEAKWEISMPTCNSKGLVDNASGYMKVKKSGKEYRGKMHRGY